MKTTTFMKLGRSVRNGALHAVIDASLTNWEGPQAFCGARIGQTVRRVKADGVGCRDCRRALGLAEDRPVRALSGEAKFGRWAKL